MHQICSTLRSWRFLTCDINPFQPFPRPSFKVELTSKLWWAEELPGEHVKTGFLDATCRVSVFLVLGEEPEKVIFLKILSGDAIASGSWTTLWVGKSWTVFPVSVYFSCMCFLFLVLTSFGAVHCWETQKGYAQYAWTQTFNSAQSASSGIPSLLGYNDCMLLHSSACFVSLFYMVWLTRSFSWVFYPFLLNISTNLCLSLHLYNRLLFWFSFKSVFLTHHSSTFYRFLLKSFL